jgi:hypothetical protein
MSRLAGLSAPRIVKPCRTAPPASARPALCNDVNVQLLFKQQQRLHVHAVSEAAASSHAGPPPRTDGPGGVRDAGGADPESARRGSAVGWAVSRDRDDFPGKNRGRTVAIMTAVPGAAQPEWHGERWDPDLLEAGDSPSAGGTGTTGGCAWSRGRPRATMPPQRHRGPSPRSSSAGGRRSARPVTTP